MVWCPRQSPGGRHPSRRFALSRFNESPKSKFSPLKNGVGFPGTHSLSFRTREGLFICPLARAGEKSRPASGCLQCTSWGPRGGQSFWVSCGPNQFWAGSREGLFQQHLELRSCTRQEQPLLVVHGKAGTTQAGLPKCVWLYVALT